MDWITLQSMFMTGMVDYTFGSVWLFGAVIITLILAMEWKMGMSSDVIIASLPIMLIGLGSFIFVDVFQKGSIFGSIIAIAILILIGIALIKIFTKR